MQNSQDLQKVLDLRRTILAGSEAHLKEQRDAGKLTARERVEKLLDEGSFTELFALVSNQNEGAGVITGCGTVDDRPVYIFAQDFTVKGGAMGKAQAEKIVKVLELAQKTGSPVLALLDSAGVRIDEGAAAMSAYSAIAAKLARLSGVCPVLALVLGPCIGGAALIAQMADITLMAENVGTMMVFGPQVMAAMNGMDVKPEELGGAKVAAGMGAAALVCENEEKTFAQARTLLGLLPSNNLEDADIVDSDDSTRLLENADAEDASALIASLSDAGSAVELYGDYAPAAKTVLARIGGRSAAFVAVSGKLDAAAMEKAARFVRFADCYNIPVISLLNTCGVYVDSIQSQGRLFKAQGQLLYAYAEATTAKLAVVTGDAIGQAYVAMGGKGNADVTYAWPGAVISALTPEAAVAVLYADEVKADKELSVEEARAKYAAQYVSETAGAIQAAQAGMVDDILDPAETRKALIAAVEMLASKRDSNPPRKHGNLPM